jgi:hypothetical protein
MVYVSKVVCDRKALLRGWDERRYDVAEKGEHLVFERGSRFTEASDQIGRSARDRPSLWDRLA